ncbi:hypothetical protein RHODOSMS8_02014 [Rhodobiaceae bacterium]|nr:hypothetical protein RHODOSMS8_02014 [Rhodobiaceae bacterium]
MRPIDTADFTSLDNKLSSYETNHGVLPGISQQNARLVLLEQLIESVRRVKFLETIQARPISNTRKDPANPGFDPLRAALLYARDGNLDEACWLVFLAIHFGKHHKDGWRLARDVYGALHNSPVWTWDRVVSHRSEFRKWMVENEATLQTDGVSRRFGNHRRYESLKADSPKGTLAVIDSYIEWISPPQTHASKFSNAIASVGQDPKLVFDELYNSLKQVTRFGRLAKFDFLCMLGKLRLAPVEAPSAYLKEATGPLRGARLIFEGSVNSKTPPVDLESKLHELGTSLDLGMQVLEDALCNWQKSPQKFVPFR